MSLLVADPAPSAATRSAPPARHARRVALAGMVGTTIEFYDFFIYGTAAALVFGTVFFPQFGGAQGALAAFATMAVAFVLRPVGSVLFGHLGDRLGRKRTLVATLLLMGLSTVAVGLLPSAATIGVAAPILLVVLRALQGLAVGGEWAGAALLAAENAPQRSRGRAAMFPQVGPMLAFGLSSLTFLVISLTVGEAGGAFLEWGWRVPFLLSGLLIGVGLFVRLKLEETPVFAAADRRRFSAAPFLQVWRRNPRAVLLAGGVLTGLMTCFTVGTVYITTYATAGLGLGKPAILAIDLVAVLTAALTTVAGAAWSDRIGRRPVVLLGSLGLVAWALLLFPLIGGGSVVAVGLGLVGLLALVGLAYGPLGAYLPELFPTGHRYTGAGLGYNLGGVAGGAVTLLVVEPLAASPIGTLAVGIFTAATVLLTVGCVLAMPETRHVALEDPAW